MAQRRLQLPGRLSRPDSAGRGFARFCQPRRSVRHRLQRHRVDRPAVEDHGRRRRCLLGAAGRFTRSEVLLDRAHHGSGLHQECRLRRAARRAALASDPRHRWRDGDAGAPAGGVSQYYRRLVRRHRRVLEGPLLRVGRGVIAGSRHRSAYPAHRDRHGAAGGDRGDRFRPGSPPACGFAAARAGRLCTQSLDPHPGLPRVAGNAGGDP